MRARSRFATIAIAISLAATAMLLALPAAALADTTPPAGHEAFAGDSSICVICHRAHTSTSLNLLRTGAGLCLTCHKNGAGADTDVTSGKYLVSSPTRPVPPNPPRHNPPMGEADGDLLGGGFTSVDTNGDGFAEPTSYGTDPVEPGTSQHDVGVMVAPFGATYSGAYAVLECSSCHTIHKIEPAGQYRYLRLQVGDKANLQVTWNGPWESSAQQIPNAPGGTYRAYTETSFGSGLTYNAGTDSLSGAPVEFTRNYRAGMSAWCSGCHSVYSNPDSPAGLPDGLGTGNRRRHKVDVTLTNTGRLTDTPDTNLPLNDPDGLARNGNETLNCLTCHKAHGTTARMDDMGIASPVANRGNLPGMGTSMLLRRDNRGVCIDCHWYLKGMGL